MKIVPIINTEYGYLTILIHRFGRLSPPVARRALSAILNYASGSRDTRLSQAQVAYRICRNPEGSKVASAGKCTIIPVNDNHVVIARQLPHQSHIVLHPIHIGETILWDGRFEVTLKRLRPRERAGKRGEGFGTPASPVFYVRNMIKTDWQLARKGIRKVRSSILPHENVRGGLPVIVNSDKKVVLIPHFKVLIDWSAGVTCDVRFNPRARLEDYVNFPLSQGKLATVH